MYLGFHVFVNCFPAKECITFYVDFFAFTFLPLLFCLTFAFTFCVTCLRLLFSSFAFTFAFTLRFGYNVEAYDMIY